MMDAGICFPAQVPMKDKKTYLSYIIDVYEPRPVIFSKKVCTEDSKNKQGAGP